MIRKEWKLTDPEAQRVMKENVAVYDKLRTILSRRCPVPDCGYMLTSVEGFESYGLPGYGDVCALCYHMYHALQGPGMKSPFYFRQLHDQWLKDNGKGSGPRWEKL